MSILSDILILICTSLIFGSVGYAFCTQKLFREEESNVDETGSSVERKKKLVQGLFTGTFILSCVLLQLIVFEIGDLMDKWYL
jgi:hypothetical protein